MLVFDSTIRSRPGNNGAQGCNTTNQEEHKAHEQFQKYTLMTQKNRMFGVGHECQTGGKWKPEVPGMESEMYHGYQITGERKNRVKVSKKSGPNKTYLS